MQSMVPQYLDASMTAFRKNQQDVRSAFEGALGANPLAELTRRNMEMFQQAAGAFIPGAGGSKEKDAEIAALKAEIAELTAALDKQQQGPLPPHPTPATRTAETTTAQMKKQKRAR